MMVAVEPHDNTVHCTLTVAKAGLEHMLGSSVMCVVGLKDSFDCLE